MSTDTYYSRRMAELRSDTHRAVIHFFQKHEESIRALPEEAYFDILLMYMDSLFASGEYEVFDRYVDEALLLALDRRIYTLKDEDVYQQLLFRKAAAVYHIGDGTQCRHLLTELLRLNPAHKLGRRFLQRCMVQTQVVFRQRLYALVIVLIMASVAGIALEILWVRPFMGEWVYAWETGRTLVFILALLTWAAGLFWMEYRARRRTRAALIKPRKSEAENARREQVI
jgi:hypothetical protein